MPNDKDEMVSEPEQLRIRAMEVAKKTMVKMATWFERQADNMDASVAAGQFPDLVAEFRTEAAHHREIAKDIRNSIAEVDLALTQKVVG